MITHDKKYFLELFRLGQLRRVHLVEAPLIKPTRWEMELETIQGETMQVETRRGDPKRFATIEAARTFAESIGFQKMEINW